MKTIKIILGIIIVLTVAFLSTGLLIKETKYSTEIEVNKPVAEVFADFENPELFKKWMPEIKSIETLNEKAGKIGSTYKMVIDNKGETLTMTEKILAFVKNEKITFNFSSKEMLKTDDFTFTSNGKTTKITQISTLKSNSYLMSCIFPYFKSTLKETSQEHLNRFKKLTEKQ